ncbi:hypothetical protein OB985_28740, partial [Bacillus cereus]|nr:hypothetical protein [Bacillus cereus]
NINSNGIYSFLKRPKLLQHREIRLFYIEFLNVVNPHFPDATPTLGITFSNIISGLKNYKEMKEIGNNKKKDKKKEQRPKQRKRCSK